MFPSEKFILNTLILCFVFFSFSSFTQTISTIAGTGTAGYNGDGIVATSAELDKPAGVCIDASGNIYIADFWFHRVRKVDAVTGNISTIAGTGTAGYNGDGIAATSAQLDKPRKVCVDASGNVYIADSYNHRIRKIDASTGIISTVAGNGTSGYNNDGIAADSAELYFPGGVFVDASGNIYIADVYNHRVRKVDASTGKISTIAGNGTAGYSGDGAAGTAAELNYPWGLCADNSGNVYIADEFNNRIREVDASTGNINTFAGTGTAGYNGDGIMATTAQLNTPSDVFADAYGRVFISDASNRIRVVDLSTSMISTIAGNGTAGYNGDGIAATSAELSGPGGIFVNASGNLFIADVSNQRVREVTNVSVLPIELLYFNAIEENENSVKCQWGTATQTNNNYFAIERSQNALTFSQIGTVQGAGTTSTENSYTFYDEFPYSGWSYYRLKQVDYDGKFTYSAISTVYIGYLTITALYPNPATDHITLSISTEQNTQATAYVYNVLGQMVYGAIIELQKGKTEIKIPLGEFAEGQYFFKVMLPSGDHTQKIFMK